MLRECRQEIACWMWRVARGCFLGPLSSWWRRPVRSQVSTPADRDLLSSLFADADAASSSIKTQSGIARFPSVASWIHTDVKGWSPLGQLLDEEQFEQLLTEAKTDLGSFVTKAGRVEFPMPAHIVTLGISHRDLA